METSQVPKRGIGSGEPLATRAPETESAPSTTAAGVVATAARMHRARLGPSLMESFEPALAAIKHGPDTSRSWTNMLRQASYGLRGQPAESIVFLGALAAFEKLSGAPQQRHVSDFELSMELLAAAKRTLADRT